MSTEHMEENLTNSLLQAIVSAPEERKIAALKTLRGELTDEKLKEPERYMTMKAVAIMLGVSPCSLWRWGVPGHDLGGRRRFRISEVQAYLDSEMFRQRTEDLKQDRKRGGT